ncbi:MAG: amidohydrolase family protein [Chloroflexi bacterium]|nr:amidohydrolase family protein [Chloroflexota bacterium]
MRAYKTISADTHLEISPEQWTWRLPAKYRDRGPRVVALTEKDLPPGLPVFGEGWIAEGIDRVVPLGMNLAAGKKPQERRTYGWYYREHHVGAGDAAQRVREMDQDGVDAEVEYAAVAGPGFLGRLKDRDLYLACIEAYNDFLAKDFCAYSPERLWGLAQVPVTGIEDAAAELKRTRDYKTLRGWQLGSWPSGKSHPSPEDDAFWSLALSLKAPLTAHVTFSPEAAGESRRSGQILEGTGAPLHSVMAGGCPRPAYTVCQMIVHGVLDRFPNLRIHFAETGAGWAPYFMEHADQIYEQFGPAKGVKLNRLPSEYFKRFALLGFQTDRAAMRNRHAIGVQNLCWGNDFPHSAGDWPESQRVIAEQMAGVPGDERRKMVGENVARFYGG